MKAIYEITIEDPTKAESNHTGGYISHTIENYSPANGRTPLTPSQRSAYENVRNTHGLIDAAFHVKKNGMVLFKFKINNPSEDGIHWQFQSTPMAIIPQPSDCHFFRNPGDATELFLLFVGKGGGKWKEHKYTLYYEDVHGAVPPFEHDPPILNGDRPPSNGFLEFFISILRVFFGIISYPFRKTHEFMEKL